MGRQGHCLYQLKLGITYYLYIFHISLFTGNRGLYEFRALCNNRCSLDG